MLEDNRNIIPICISIFLIVRLVLSYVQKISLLLCLILEIAVKKTLKLDFEDDLNFFEDFFGIPLARPINVRKQDKLNSNYFFTFPGGWLGGWSELK